MHASTPSRCFRSESESTHSVTRFHASSLETSVMGLVTLVAVEKFIIQGGVPLSGEIVPAGNKNAALPILAACLLTDEELVIGNVPRIRDVESMLELLEKLGVEVDWSGDNEVRLQA